MKRTAYIVPIGVLIAFALLMWAGLKVQARLIPIGEGLPDRDIVFTIDSDTLGFVNSDGSDLVTRSIEWSNGIFIDMLGYSARALDTAITWSGEGSYLAGRYLLTNPEVGVPLIIQRSGEISKCRTWGTDLIGTGRVWAVNDMKIVTIAHATDDARDRVVLADMNSCKIVKELCEATEIKEGLRDVSISSQGWLAIGRWTDDGGEHIVVFNSNGEEQFVLTEAVFPTWSSSGQWLAYTKDDGLYIVNTDGTNSTRILQGRIVQSPTWSPDDQWIAYSRAENYSMGIYKLNIASGEELKISPEGSHPAWRHDN